MTTSHPQGSVRTGLVVGALVVLALGAAFVAALLLSDGIRELANAAAIDFAKAAARGKAPKGAPRNDAALEALRDGDGFVSSVTATSGFSSGMACVTISRPRAASVRVLVVVSDGVGQVASYGLADACRCPARLREGAVLACS